MCTVTIIPLVDDSPRKHRSFRMVCNRDEKRNRPAAQPPVIRKLGSLQALMPIDPVSGGTWISVNSAGLVATLLNVNDHDASSARLEMGESRQSRGTIIPLLMHCDDASAAADALCFLDPGNFPPFRLVLSDGRTVQELRSDGRALIRQSNVFDEAPRFFTSSGLGDALVQGPRRELFEEFFADWNNLTARQDEFHTHVWPDQPHLSVFMSRPDACTVSQTVIEVRDHVASLFYTDTAPGGPTRSLSLDIARIAIDS